MPDGLLPEVGGPQHLQLLHPGDAPPAPLDLHLELAVLVDGVPLDLLGPAGLPDGLGQLLPQGGQLEVDEDVLPGGAELPLVVLPAGEVGGELLEVGAGLPVTEHDDKAGVLLEPVRAGAHLVGGADAVDS